LGIHSALQVLEKELLLQPDELMMDDSLYSIDRLQRLASQYEELQFLVSGITKPHPFLITQQDRIEKVKSTLKKDIQEAFSIQRKQGNNMELFNLLEICRIIDIYPL
jgi:hypothetical protein